MLDAAISVVPMAAGILIVLACAALIYRNPQVSNSVAIFLFIGGLLCISPTLRNLDVSGAGWTVKLSIAKEDLGSQIAELRGQIAALEKKVGLPLTTPATPAQPAILISYDKPRRDLALKIQAELTKKGYSANAIYDDFSQLQTRQPAGSTRLVCVPSKEEFARKLLADLKGIAPDFAAVSPTVASNLEAAPLQIRLF